MNKSYDYIKDEIDPNICTDAVGKRFFKKLEEGGYTRDENPISHYCCYFLPYKPDTKKVFLIHHKKSGLWIFPGGHIDKGEDLIQTLNREIEEELGIKDKVKNKIKPFLLTITPINNPVQPCKEHLDFWYRFSTDGSEFNVDPREFHDAKWLSTDEARELITDPPNLEALDKMEILFSQLTA